MEWEQGETFSRQKVERFSPKAAGESLAGENWGENRELRRFSRSESAREHHIGTECNLFWLWKPIQKEIHGTKTRTVHVKCTFRMTGLGTPLPSNLCFAKEIEWTDQIWKLDRGKEISRLIGLFRVAKKRYFLEISYAFIALESASRRGLEIERPKRGLPSKQGWLSYRCARHPTRRGCQSSEYPEANTGSRCRSGRASVAGSAGRNSGKKNKMTLDNDNSMHIKTNNFNRVRGQMSHPRHGMTVTEDKAALVAFGRVLMSVKKLPSLRTKRVKRPLAACASKRRSII